MTETSTELPILTVFNHPKTGDSIGSDPVKTIEEQHGKNSVKVTIFQKEKYFVYAYQIKIGKVIRQKVPLTADTGLVSIDSAQTAAWKEIVKICSENRAKRALTDFCYNQKELF